MVPLRDGAEDELLQRLDDLNSLRGLDWVVLPGNEDDEEGENKWCGA